ncbi:family 16 glycosylhydrolase [Siccirubricoccus phaeus]|uniref:family 16 glycosylhydrolase n=1 Tax=Siccirubricoccus phaeus TaxID=2595053 RepID=UPI0011F21529|nr:family 16 glycosylhydrolase [Siccirubricoccus phaeus]
MSKAFYESFNNGIGALNHTWGKGIDTSVPGQVTVSGNSGIMQKPWGAAAGQGYGTYKIVAKLNGADEPGPAGLLWPGDDKWPGPEMDLVEFIDGRPYGTIHHKGSNGKDVWRSKYYNGVNEDLVHTYELKWEPGKATFYVDGKNWGSYTTNIAEDYANGGVNMTFSIMNSNKDTSITVYEVSYKPLKGSKLEEETVEEGSWDANGMDSTAAAAKSSSDWDFA